MTREQLAAFLDTTVLEIGRPTKEKILDSDGGKLYEIRKCVGQYARWLRNDSDSRSLNEELQKAKLAKLKIEGQWSGDTWKGKTTVVELGKGFSLDRGDVTKVLSSAGVAYVAHGKAHLYPVIEAISALLRKKLASATPSGGETATLREHRPRRANAAGPRQRESGSRLRQQPLRHAHHR